MKTTTWCSSAILIICTIVCCIDHLYHLLLYWSSAPFTDTHSITIPFWIQTIYLFHYFFRSSQFSFILSFLLFLHIFGSILTPSTTSLLHLLLPLPTPSHIFTSLDFFKLKLNLSPFPYPHTLWNPFSLLLVSFLPEPFNTLSPTSLLLPFPPRIHNFPAPYLIVTFPAFRLYFSVLATIFAALSNLPFLTYDVIYFMTTSTVVHLAFLLFFS